MNASLALVNGRIHTMDPRRPQVEALACAGGRVVAMGDRASVLDRVDGRTRLFDLKGRSAVPGFVDAHAHLGSLGATLLRFDLSGVKSYAEVIEKTAARAKGARPGEWVIGRGWALEEAPHHAALSARTSENPVWLRRVDGHSGLANAGALQRAGIHEASPDPPGGKIGRDADGRPTGVLYESAMDLVERHLPERSATLEEEVLAAQGEALRLGVTCVQDACVDATLERVLLKLEAAGALTLRVYGMAWRTDQKSLAAHVRRTAPRHPIGGRLSMRAIKIFMDGSLGSRSAWMIRPAGGVARLRAEELEEVARAALASGWQVCTHAIGSRANREALDAYERALREFPGVDHRLRIEHAQHVEREDLPRFARLGVIASVQPAHAVADRPLCEARFDEEVLRGSYAWRTLNATGARLALGSDAPVDRIDPRWTFACATERAGWRTEETLSREEALRGMTRDAAYGGFMESERGMLAPGYAADVVVLSHDWLERGAAMESRVLLTVAGGEVAYAADDFA